MVQKEKKQCDTKNTLWNIYDICPEDFCSRKSPLEKLPQKSPRSLHICSSLQKIRCCPCQSWTSLEVVITLRANLDLQTHEAENAPTRNSGFLFVGKDVIHICEKTSLACCMRSGWKTRPPGPHSSLELQSTSRKPTCRMELFNPPNSSQTGSPQTAVNINGCALPTLTVPMNIVQKKLLVTCGFKLEMQGK